MQTSTHEKARFLRSQVMAVYDKYSSDTCNRAFDLLDQIERGDKSEVLFRTVEGHLEAARKIHGLMKGVS